MVIRAALWHCKGGRGRVEYVESGEEKHIAK